MNDRDFLIWLHQRMQYVYKEDPLKDYMHKLRAIILSTPEDKCTPNNLPYNSLDELLEV